MTEQAMADDLARWNEREARRRERIVVRVRAAFAQPVDFRAMTDAEVAAFVDTISHMELSA